MNTLNNTTTNSPSGETAPSHSSLSPSSATTPTTSVSPSLSPTETPSGSPSIETTLVSEGSEKDDDCHCDSCHRQLHIVTLKEFQDYFDYYIAEYNNKSQNPNQKITIELEVLDATASSSTSSNSPTKDAFQTLQQRLLYPQEEEQSNWDGAMFPAHMMGTLENRLLDLDDYLLTSTSNNLLPFVQRQAHYGNTTKIMPLDGNTVNMYYRKDLFQQYNISIPRTWEEYNRAAEYFDVATDIRGSCTTFRPECQKNAYWTSLVLSSMTQTMGTQFGFLFDPETGTPNIGPAMEETLRILGEQFQQGYNNNNSSSSSTAASEEDGECENQAFANGECALTYTWENQWLTTMATQDLDIGIAPTPGSSKVLDRTTGQLEQCTPVTCPFGTYYDDIGIVNRAPYSAFGGWAAGISNSTKNAQAMADFFSFLQSQSFQDVLPNDRSTFVHPYQYENTQAVHWINNAGVVSDRALEYTESVKSINSENAVLDLRMPNANQFYLALEEEVHSYFLEHTEDMRQGRAGKLRKQAATRIETRLQNLASEQSGFLQSYHDSLGYSTVPEEAFNYIDEDIRSVAWGLSGLICFASVALIVWTLLFRSNRVMKAFQPFLLIQCAMGVLLMGAAIIPLGFDDKTFSVDTLNMTCMVGPWLYVVGFTIFYSSVYCKIRECRKIFKEPHKYKVLCVAPLSDLKFTMRLLILNGSILAAWTVTDPLKWERNDVEGGKTFPDGTQETYGMCHGHTNGTFAFAVVLFVMNLAILLIGIIRALKCRFLVLEYNELQWLTLSLFPFFECWLIGGPVVALTTERPTLTFATLAFVIAVSSASAGLAIFAPKDWYVRKYRYLETRSRVDTDHTSSAGILVLKHPTFENQKQLDRLQLQLEEAHTCNTELEIEIRGMKDRFREMSTGGDKFAARRNMFRAVVADNFGSPVSTGAKAKVQEDLTAQARDDGLAAIEQFEKVWKMPDEEDETEVDISSVIPGPLESFSPLKTGKALSDMELAETTRNDLGLGRGPLSNDMCDIDEESLTERSAVTEVSELDDPDAIVKKRDFRDLNKMINMDDFKALESKAQLLAQSFKEKLTGSRLVGASAKNTEEKSSPAKAPSVTQEGSEQDSQTDDSMDIVLLESTGQPSGSPVEEDCSSKERSRTNSVEEASSAQSAGEPSGGDDYETYTIELKPETPVSNKAFPSKAIRATSPNGVSSADSPKKGGVSFTSDTLFNASSPTAYNIGEWSAVGGLNAVLTDFSDTSSFSSATSSAFSVSSMEGTTRASSLESTFAKELDSLVARKDWDGVQLAAKSYESFSPDASQALSIEDIKKRKRELEASWRHSVSRSLDSEPI
eukprot:scaffold26366_cov117-Cylindrotheca_fusiformis.AAC.3